MALRRNNGKWETLDRWEDVWYEPGPFWLGWLLLLRGVGYGVLFFCFPVWGPVWLIGKLAQVWARR